MNSSTPFRLAKQQSISSLKISEWRALIVALILAITIASLMAVLGERIERTLLRQGSAILGADLVLSSSRAIDQTAITAAKQAGLLSSEVIQLGTMANSGDNFLLVTVRALNAPYPRGEINLSPHKEQPIPNIGEAWAEQSTLDRLNLDLGDNITLGNISFKLTAIIQSAPDRGRGFISFNPQLIINRAQLTATGLLGPGARASYRQLFAGDTSTLKQFKTELKKTLKTGEKLSAIDSEESQQNSALTKASSYLRLGALFALLISAMTIFLSLRRFTQSQHKRAALLKSIGLSNKQLLQLYLYQLGFAWAFCSLLGILLALIMEHLGLTLLQGLLPQPVPNASAITYASGPLLGLAILACLGLPSLFQLQQSNPIQLLQGQKLSLNWGKKWPYFIGIMILLGCTSWYLNNFLLTLSLTLTLLVLGSVLGWIGSFLSKTIAQKLAPYHRLGHLLLSRVQQQQRWYRIQIPVICLLFALLSTNLIALNDLLDRWQAQLPENTPNHFLINIQDWEKDEVETLLRNYDVNNPLWPIYRGRLSKVNGLTLDKALTKEQLDHPSLNRELNITANTSIPIHNALTTGVWKESISVSVEEKVAEELGLKLGDKISFNIAGREVSAPISNFRRVRWDSFQPNFYFIFSPDQLKGFSASYLTSFHLGENSASVSRELIKQFPTLTLIDVRQVLDQLKQLLSRLSLLSSLLMLLTTAAGLILLYVTLTQELEQRRYENALLQTLGASQRQCKQLDRLEMGLIGAVSGLFAALITELTLWPIHHQLLKLDPVLHPYLWGALPILSSLLFMLISSLSHRQQSLQRSYRTLTAK